MRSLLLIIAVLSSLAVVGCQKQETTAPAAEPAKTEEKAPADKPAGEAAAPAASTAETTK